ncbi:hypothetical protein T265_08982 [Opisthorchis viverrini]|uniref:Uncharacterized protein n=1 Tax=Opisthorchis viverrini TaxID=6198 RepID=A0A074Z772_OPIVI|nr:hypothetical protein T265_08982 [Opisthorchis viverrini]KER23036.1 hypothetical protein T265_08982 [Opisthorchis viverrini]
MSRRIGYLQRSSIPFTVAVTACTGELSDLAHLERVLMTVFGIGARSESNFEDVRETAQHHHPIT